MRDADRADHWDTAAEHYEKTAQPFTALYVEAALEWVPLTSNSHILDVAAGTGFYAYVAGGDEEHVAGDYGPGGS